MLVSQGLAMGKWYAEERQAMSLQKVYDDQLPIFNRRRRRLSEFPEVPFELSKVPNYPPRRPRTAPQLSGSEGAPGKGQGSHRQHEAANNIQAQVQTQSLAGEQQHQQQEEEEEEDQAKIIKRDSHHSSNAEFASQRSQFATSVVGVPTIVVHHDDARYPPNFSRVTPKRTQAKPPLRPSRSMSPSQMQRVSSFRGINVPSLSTSMDDLDLCDLAGDKIEFSHRGSLLFGGKKMQELLAAQGGSSPRRTSPVPTPSPVNSILEVDEASEEPPAISKSMETTHLEEPPKQGLVSGRRTPSMQMLQSIIHGGRVLSAEEVSFSRRVRSQYEHGDERASQWFESLDMSVSGKDSTRSTPTPETSLVGDLTVPKSRLQSCDQWPLQDARSSYISVSGYAREASELAGGIEDWEDVDGRAVDRYGFIRHNPNVSRFSSGSSQHEDTRSSEVGMQRVATSLRLESQQPRGFSRKLKRMPSMQSSRSAPPRPSGDWTFKKGPASVRSSHAVPSKSNLLRSKEARLLAKASDMLTVPPGLADIREHDDAGKTASAIKKREWSREQKWQAMARPVRQAHQGKGGGMAFEFDTTNPKVIERTWKGIPDRWRATAWRSFLSSSAKKRKTQTTDEELIRHFHSLQEMSSADDVQIDVDVPRTVNLHIMFRRRYRGGQRLLFRLLRAISLYFPDLGYVQGMASIAATLLCYYDEENAFVMMVRIWQLRGVEKIYQPGFEGLMTALRELEQDWIGKDIVTHLDSLGVTSTSYGTRWYLTLFNMSVPFPAQLRIWDVFMLLGDTRSSNNGAFAGAELDVLHATSAALIDATRDILIDSDFENAMKVLTSFVPIKDEDLLMHVAKMEWRQRKKMAGVRV